MTDALILHTIQLHIAILASRVDLSNCYSEATRRDMHHLTYDLIYDLHDRGVLDLASCVELLDKLGIAYVQGGL